MLPKSNKDTSKWLVFTTMPFQMAITIIVFYFIGNWADKKWMIPNDWGTKCLTLLGIFIAIYQIISQVNKLNKNG